MKKLMLLSLLFIGGCSLSLSGGVTADAFYPKMQTAKGGSFGDPAESRGQSMRPTVSHVRNNEDRHWLQKFFDTSPDRISRNKAEAAKR